MIEILAFSCPLLLAAAGALFSEYAGCLALFLDSAITLSGFLTYSFTLLTKSAILGTALSTLSLCLLTLLFAFIVEKTKAERFIAAIAINLFYGALVSLFSSLIFKTRGVLTAAQFIYKSGSINIISICLTLTVIAAAVVFLTNLFQDHRLQPGFAFSKRCKSCLIQNSFLGAGGLFCRSCRQPYVPAHFFFCAKPCKRKRLACSGCSFYGQTPPLADSAFCPDFLCN